MITLACLRQLWDVVGTGEKHGSYKTTVDTSDLPIKALVLLSAKMRVLKHPDPH